MGWHSNFIPLQKSELIFGAKKQTFVFSKVWKCKAQQNKNWLIEHVGEEKAAQLFDSREEVEEFFNFMDRDYDGNLSFEVF